MFRTITFEQAVYGSFPFWHRGYAVLARSAGCRDEWLAALKLAAQRYGEPPTGVDPRACLFALPLPRGPWMIVGVCPQGCDDQGRPGALAFHGLFVGRWSYLRAGASPFAFGLAFRREWHEEDQRRDLPVGSIVADSGWIATGEEPIFPAEQVRAIGEALGRKRKVVIVSPGPIDATARRVWGELPGRVRRRASLATWAFRNDNPFDLVAVPRDHGLRLDGSELVLGREAADGRA